jgi:hypothetical protein
MSTAQLFALVRPATLLVALAIGVPSKAVADPPPGARLGAGVDELETTIHPIAVCFDVTQDRPSGMIPNLLSTDSTFVEQRITSQEDIQAAFGIDAAVSASTAWGDFDVRQRYFSDIAIRDENFYWLVVANYETDYQFATHVTLCQEAKDLLFEYTRNTEGMLIRGRYRSGGLQAFYNAYGTHYYFAASYGARFSMLFEFMTHEEATNKDYTGHFAYSNIGIGAEANILSQARELKKRSQVMVHLDIRGDCTSDLASCVQSGDCYKCDAIHPCPATLAAKLEDLRACVRDPSRNPKAISLLKVSYDEFPEIVDAKSEEAAKPRPDPFLIIYRDTQLAKLYNMFLSNQSCISRAQRFLEMANIAERLYVLSDATKRLLKSVIAEHEAQNELVITRGRRCLKSSLDPDNFSPAECTTEDLPALDCPEFKLDLTAGDRDVTGIGNWSFVTTPDDTLGYPSRPGPAFEPDVYPLTCIEPSIGKACDCDRPGYGESIYEAWKCHWAEWDLTTVLCSDSGISRKYHSGTHLWVDRSSFNRVALYIQGQWATIELLPIGDPHMVADINGCQRPQIGVGNSAQACVMRILEYPTVSDSGSSTIQADGLPLTELQFILFDQFGYVRRFAPALPDGRTEAIFKYRPIAGSIQPRLSVAPAALELTAGLSYVPRGHVHNTYYGNLLTINGKAPFQWSYDGALPGGMKLGKDDGVISGVPVNAGLFAVLVRVVDADNNVASRSVSIVIADVCGDVDGNVTLNINDAIAILNALFLGKYPANSEACLRVPGGA